MQNHFTFIIKMNKKFQLNHPGKTGLKFVWKIPIYVLRDNYYSYLELMKNITIITTLMAK